MVSSKCLTLATLGLLSAPVRAYYWLPETLEYSVTSCTVPKNTTGDDDSPSVRATVAACGNSSRVEFSANETYNLLTPISFTGLANVEFVVSGNISLSDNVTYVESVTGDSALYPGHWITIKSSTGVTFTGSQDPSSGWFVGHGEQWWPMANNTANDARPHFFSLSATSLRLRDVKVYNPVAWVFSLGGTDIYMTNTTLDARSADPVGAFPFNTDGIDLSASDVVIDGWTSWNGDDVLNVAPPATNVTMRNVVAYGTHGVSASCASGTGGDWLFENVLIYDSLIGARFKGKLGTTCRLSNVTWRNFAVFNTSYPVHFIENYVDQEVGVPAGTNTSLAAYATNFTWENIVAMTSEELRDGSCVSDPCWSSTDGTLGILVGVIGMFFPTQFGWRWKQEANIAAGLTPTYMYFFIGETNHKAMYIMCHDSDHCQDFHFDDIVLFGAVSDSGSTLDIGEFPRHADSVLLSGRETRRDGVHRAGRCRRHGNTVHKRNTPYAELTLARSFPDLWRRERRR